MGVPPKQFKFLFGQKLCKSQIRKKDVFKAKNTVISGIGKGVPNGMVA